MGTSQDVGRVAGVAAAPEVGVGMATPRGVLPSIGPTARLGMNRNDHQPHRRAMHVRNGGTIVGYARHVGRIGALAVALGVGVALITSPGVAWADDTDSSSSETSSKGGGPAGASSKDDAASNGSTGGSTNGTDPSPGVSTTASVGTSKGIESKHTGAQNDSATSKATGILAGVSGRTDTNTSSTVTADAPPVPVGISLGGPPTAGSEEVPTQTVVPEAPALVVPPPGSGDGPPTTGDAGNAEVGEISAHDDRRGAASPVTSIGSAPTSARTDAPVASETVVLRSDSPITSSAAGVSSLPTPVSVAPVTLRSPTPVEAFVALPGTLVTVATGVVRAVLSAFVPGLVGAPGAPASPPMLWAVLSWVRRELFNTTPTLAPGPAVSDRTTGLITGSLGARDADGDPLSFSVRQDPANGTLVVAGDGTYVYTPRAGFTGQDTFVVAVTDSGPDGLLGFLQPERGHTAAAAVTLTVVSTGPTVVVDGVDGRTGAVTGRITGGGLATGTVTATLATGPARGSVVVGADGSFVYTPTPITRVRAAYEPIDVFDAFTVTLAGEDVPSTTVSVRPVIAATRNALVYQVSEDVRGINSLRAPVVDPVTGRVYVIQDLRPFDESSPEHGYSLLAFAPDGTVISTEIVGGTSPRLSVDPLTGAAILTLEQVETLDGRGRTLVSIVTADGGTRMFSMTGRPQGPMVFNPTTGRTYQVLTLDDGVNPARTRIMTIESGGVDRDFVSFDGSPVGGLVTDPVTGATFLTSQYFDVATRSQITQINTVTADGKLVRTPGEGGTAVGSLVLNPITGEAVQTVSSRDRVTRLVTTVVIAVNADGTVARTQRIAGPPSGGVVINPVSGEVYQTTAAPIPPTDGVFTSFVTIMDTDGVARTTAAIPEIGDYGVMVNPATGTAYLVTGATGEQYVSVIASDGSVRTSALLGRSTAPMVFNPVGDSAYVDMGNAFAVVDGDGAVRVLPGALRGVPVFDAAIGRGYVTTVLEGKTILTVLDPDGRSINTLEFDGEIDGVNTVVNPANGHAYLIAVVDGVAKLNVIGRDGLIAGHVMPGGAAALGAGPTFVKAPVVANPVTGGAFIFNQRDFFDEAGVIRISDYVSVVSPDGTELTTLLDRTHPTTKSFENVQVNPVTGVGYLTATVGSTEGFVVVTTSFQPDGTTTTTEGLVGVARPGGLVSDSKTGTVYQLTSEGVWVVDVAVT